MKEPVSHSCDVTLAGATSLSNAVNDTATQMTAAITQSFNGIPPECTPDNKTNMMASTSEPNSLPSQTPTTSSFIAGEFLFASGDTTDTVATIQNFVTANISAMDRISSLWDVSLPISPDTLSVIEDILGRLSETNGDYPNS